MNLDEQIDFIGNMAGWFPDEKLREVAESLRELNRLREVERVSRNVLILLRGKARKPLRDKGHRCEYRVQLEAVEQSIRTALKESSDGQ